MGATPPCGSVWLLEADGGDLLVEAERFEVVGVAGDRGGPAGAVGSGEDLVGAVGLDGADLDGAGHVLAAGAVETGGAVGLAEVLAGVEDGAGGGQGRGGR